MDVSSKSKHVKRKNRSNTPLITQEELKTIVEYSPEAGVLIFKKDYWKNKKGTIVGGKDKNGYLVTSIKGLKYFVHHLVFLYMSGRYPSTGQLDHINRIRDDNRWENLREATSQQNLCNKPGNSKNKKYKGTIYDKRFDLWCCRVQVKGTSITVGYFHTEREAAIAYNEAALLYHKEFAFINDISYSEEELLYVRKKAKKRRSKNSKSSYVGVYWHTQSSRWRSSFNHKDLGNFTSEIEAAKRYDLEAQKVLGDLAKLNFPQI